MREYNNLLGELNHYKADTLSEYGQRIENTSSMLIKEETLIARRTAVLKRLDTKISDKKCGKKRLKKYIKVKEKVETKLINNQIKRDQLIKLKDKFINDYKAQREALGLIDHSFVDDFYKNK